MSQAWIIVLLIGICQGVSKASDCTERGRFPNDILEDCRGYTTCIGSGPTFYQYDLPCPAGFVYSHLDNQCTNSSTYKCYPEHTCTGIGNFANPNSSDCSTYIACAQGLSNIVTARLVQCPQNTVFSPIAETCVQTPSYDCFQAARTTTMYVKALELTEEPVTEGHSSPVPKSEETPVTKEKNKADAGVVRVNLSHFIFVLALGIVALIL